LQIGCNFALSKEVEADIVLGIKDLVQRGLGPTRLTLLDVVQDYLFNYEITNPFKDSRPGPDWLRSFTKRHRFSLKKGATMQFARFNTTRNPFIIYDFYDTLHEEMTTLNIMNKPECIFNLDETSFPLDPGSDYKTYGTVGEPTIRVVAGGGRENVTVMATINAAGQSMPPLVIFKGARIPHNCYADRIINGTGIGISPNGWMTREIFDQWFYQHFLKFIEEKGISPVLLIVDGHSSHTSIQTLRKATASGVSILRLPAHCTDLLQPLDVGVFSPLKAHWNTMLVNYNTGHEGSRQVAKNTFMEMLADVWPVGLSLTNIKGGFSSTGIFPFDKSKYSSNRFDNTKLKLYNQWLVLGKPVTEAGEIDLSELARTNQVHPSLFEEQVEDVSDIDELDSTEVVAGSSRDAEPVASTSCEQQPTASTSGVQQPTASTSCEQQPTASTSGEEQPTASTSCEQQPTASTSGEEQPTASTSASTERNSSIPSSGRSVPSSSGTSTTNISPPTTTDPVSATILPFQYKSKGKLYRYDASSLSRTKVIKFMDLDEIILELKGRVTHPNHYYHVSLLRRDEAPPAINSFKNSMKDRVEQVVPSPLPPSKTNRKFADFKCKLMTKATFVKSIEDRVESDLQKATALATRKEERENRRKEKEERKKEGTKRKLSVNQNKSQVVKTKRKRKQKEPSPDPNTSSCSDNHFSCEDSTDHKTPERPGPNVSNDLFREGSDHSTDVGSAVCSQEKLDTSDSDSDTPPKALTTVKDMTLNNILYMPTIKDSCIGSGEFYACYYTQPNTFYWGQIVKTFSDDPDSPNHSSEVEFLKKGFSSLGKDPKDWCWKKRDDKRKDIATLKNHFIFYGPLSPRICNGIMFFPDHIVFGILINHIAGLVDS
jgi:hypothetical protein